MPDTKRIPAIDGLRGLSILLVVFCHLDVPWLRGGYVGVDVFFAISGFVITGSLFNHLGEPNLVADFYERRARRLLPALFLTLLACYGAFWWVDERSDLLRLGEVGALAAIGASNIFFARTTGYFDDAALENPLLHTWSLAVEEQFYLLLAVFLLLVRFVKVREASRMQSMLFYFMAAGTLVSVGMLAHCSHTDARFSYFQLPTRFWEISSGSLLFLVRRKYPFQVPAAGSWLGLGLVLATAVLFDEGTHYPGFRALFPVLGAHLLIGGSEGGGFVARRILRTPGLVFLGIISYTLYLVHWPVIVFAQSYIVRDLNAVEKIAVAGISLVLATALSYGWERPALSRRWFPTKLALWGFVTAGLAFFLGIGAYSLSRPQALEASDEPPLPMLSQDQARLIIPSLVPGTTGFVDPRQIPTLGPDLGRITAIWGDSHALNLLPNLVPREERFGLTYKFYICWATMPLLDIGGSTAINRHNQEVLDILVHDARVRNVVLQANWTGYLEGLRYFGQREGRRPRFLFHGASVMRGGAYNVFEAQLRATLMQLSSAGKNVFLCTPHPTYPFNAGKGIAQMQRRGSDPNVTLSYSLEEYLTANRKILEIFDRVAGAYPRVYIIPLHLDFFVDGRSLLVKKNQSLYFDGQHLSLAGAEQMGDRVSEFLKAKGQ